MAYLSFLLMLLLVLRVGWRMGGLPKAAAHRPPLDGPPFKLHAALPDNAVVWESGDRSFAEGGYDQVSLTGADN